MQHTPPSPERIEQTKRRPGEERSRLQREVVGANAQKLLGVQREKERDYKLKLTDERWATLNPEQKIETLRDEVRLNTVLQRQQLLRSMAA